MKHARIIAVLVLLHFLFRAVQMWIAPRCLRHLRRKRLWPSLHKAPYRRSKQRFLFREVQRFPQKSQQNPNP